MWLNPSKRVRIFFQRFRTVIEKPKPPWDVISGDFGRWFPERGAPTSVDIGILFVEYVVLACPLIEFLIGNPPAVHELVS